MRSIIALIGLVAILSTPVLSAMTSDPNYEHWIDVTAAELNFFMVTYTNTGTDVPPAGCVPDTAFGKVDDTCCTDGGIINTWIPFNFADSVVNGFTCIANNGAGGDPYMNYLGCTAEGEIEHS